MGGLTSYQLILIVILVLWPVAITALLFVMSRLEHYVNRSDADTPQEAGLEPVSGRSADKEVRIVFGDKVVGDTK
jgi:NADH:ubiquinone oxidoreductase subunit 3 (subunit A)